MGRLTLLPEWHDLARIDPHKRTSAGTQSHGGDMDIGSISIHDQIRCVKREIALRERAYPRWIRRGDLDRETAALELTRMRAVLKTLTDIANNPGNFELSP